MEQKKSLETISKIPINKNSENAEKTGNQGAFRLKVRDHKIPQRGILWYLIFTLLFIFSTTVIVILMDWFLLFFVICFAGYTLWRNTLGHEITLEINDSEVRVNTRTIPFDEIESFHFSSSGNDFTITFHMMKIYLPRLTFIFEDEKNINKLAERLDRHVPETEPKEENIPDFLIRKLKI